MDYYQVLGVSPEATDAQIKAAWRKLVRMTHPDIVGDGAVHMFSMVSDAYAVLSNPVDRAAYDEGLRLDALGYGSSAPADSPVPDASWGEGSPLQEEEEDRVSEDSSSASSFDTAWPEDRDEDEVQYEDEYSQDEARWEQEDADLRDKINREDADFERARRESRMPPSPVDDYKRSKREGKKTGTMPTPKIDKRYLDWMYKTYSPLNINAPASKQQRWVLMTVFTLLSIFLAYYTWVVKDLVFGAIVICSLLPALSVPYLFTLDKGVKRWVVLISAMALVSVYSVVDLVIDSGNRTNNELYFDALLFGVYSVVSLFTGKVWRRWRRESTIIPGVYIPKYNIATGPRIIGKPGEGLEGARDKYGETRVSKGMMGEQATGDLLEQLLVIPGVYVMHGLRFPGTAKADIDHAVICGNRIALIDSKAWAPGNYTWGKYGEIFRDGERGVMYMTHFHTAVERMRGLLDNVEVHGWIVAHPVSDGVITTPSEPEGPESIRLVDAQRMLEEVGNWLSEKSPSSINSHAFAQLWQQKN